MNAADAPGHVRDGWTILVPVKAIARAKSRLARSLSPAIRRTLVLAMATDVVTACLDCPGVSAVLVVGSDPEVETLARDLGAGFVRDPASASPAGPGDSRNPQRWDPQVLNPQVSDPQVLNPQSHDPHGPDPLNAAVAGAMSALRGPVGVVAADLPGLDAGQLSRILAEASRHGHSVVVDHRGLGTTMAFWTGNGPRVSRFGVGSAGRFLGSGGAVPLPVDDDQWCGATRDVDTPGDLEDLAGRPIGAATLRALRGVPFPLRGPGGAESVTMVR